MELFTSGRQTHGLQNLGLHLTDMCLYVTSSILNSFFLTFCTLEHNTQVSAFYRFLLIFKVIWNLSETEHFLHSFIDESVSYHLSIFLKKYLFSHCILDFNTNTSYDNLVF